MESVGQLRTAHKLLTKHESACRTAHLLSQQNLEKDSREQSSRNAETFTGRCSLSTPALLLAELSGLVPFTHSTEECAQRQEWAEHIALASRSALRQHGKVTLPGTGGQGTQQSPGCAAIFCRCAASLSESSSGRTTSRDR